jgi:hypothetical protein
MENISGRRCGGLMALRVTLSGEATMETATVASQRMATMGTTEGINTAAPTNRPKVPMPSPAIRTARTGSDAKARSPTRPPITVPTRPAVAKMAAITPRPPSPTP